MPEALFPDLLSAARPTLALFRPDVLRPGTEAGLDGTEGGSFRLRHTFALRQLRRGTDAVQVARWLGVEPEAMAKYRRVVTSPEQVI